MTLSRPRSFWPRFAKTRLWRNSPPSLTSTRTRLANGEPSFYRMRQASFPGRRRNARKSNASSWSTDITYIRLKNGFAYLTAVIDWYSRRILSWRLSTSLSTDFWKTLKQEDIYIRGYETVTECRQGLKEYFVRYNDERLHSSLDWNTPSDVYFKRVRLGDVA